MGSGRMWLAVVMLVWAAGCGKKAPPGSQADLRTELQAGIKAQITIIATTTTTATETATATAMANLTGTVTGTFTSTITSTIYYTSPVTYSRTATSATYHNGGGYITGSASGTATATHVSGSLSVTGTATVTGTIGAWIPGTGTRTLTVWANKTTASLTVLQTGTATGIGTGTISYTRTETQTVTGTATQTSVADGGATDAGGPICTQDWGSTTCGQFCTGQTQEDRRHCNLFLDCYFANNCSPSTCGGQDDVCGVNHAGLNQWGMAPKIVADQVWKCMGCPGSIDCAVKPNGTLCADGNACTQYDTCQNGVCVGDIPVTCTASDECHVAGACDATNGQCSNPPRTGGPTDVVPAVICVNDKGGGLYEALFGYTNPNSDMSTIPVGSNNRFHPAPAGLGQTEDFLPIVSSGAFSVRFNGDPLSWILPGGCATASLASPACPPTPCSPTCKAGQQCVGGKCVTQCGDGLCAGDEGCGTCPADCGCAPGQVCLGHGCAKPVQCGGVGGWHCGNGTSFGVYVDCGACPGGKTCTSNHRCQ
jgi:hypothetical protein